VKVLVDHNLSPRIAAALQALFEGQHQVESIKSLFGRTDVKDIDWIEHIARTAPWAVVSGDRRITKSPSERQAFRRSSAVGFFLAPALQKAPVRIQLARLLMLWEIIESTAQTMQPGSMFELPVKSQRLRPIA
jgi:hypothetical protein